MLFPRGSFERLQVLLLFRLEVSPDSRPKPLLFRPRASEEPGPGANFTTSEPPTPRSPHICPSAPTRKRATGWAGVARGEAGRCWRSTRAERGDSGTAQAAPRAPRSRPRSEQASARVVGFPLRQKASFLLRKQRERKVSSRVCFGFSSVCLPIKKWPPRRQLCGFHSVKRIRGKAPAPLDFRLRFATPGAGVTLRHLPLGAVPAAAPPAAQLPWGGAGQGGAKAGRPGERRFPRCREVSIVIFQIDTGASSDEVLQVMESRHQGNSSRDQQTPTVLDSQARFAKETCGGWNHGCGRAESAGGGTGLVPP
uniref:uncharacterized protein LOC132695426 n=1 Tax=Panthera onca TaxID=9690 RepID=UPI0029533130|nr:uncharacterized protein LOC132695426 [Panthera onca]